MSSIIFYLLILVVYLLISAKKKGAKKDDGNGQGRFGRGRRNPARSTDGHILRGEKDITCRQFGHRHDDDSTPRFIVHDDPEDGYILLNGIKMRISEADRYENQI